MIDRRALLTTFRERLEVVVRRSGLSRGDFAIQNELDRSTLSQLLSASNRRLAVCNNQHKKTRGDGGRSS